MILTLKNHPSQDFLETLYKAHRYIKKLFQTLCELLNLSVGYHKVSARCHRVFARCHREANLICEGLLYPHREIQVPTEKRANFIWR